MEREEGPQGPRTGPWRAHNEVVDVYPAPDDDDMDLADTLDNVKNERTTPLTSVDRVGGGCGGDLGCEWRRRRRREESLSYCFVLFC
jgi:hypothetical protein